jgi:hypothetical protein
MWGLRFLYLIVEDSSIQGCGALSCTTMNYRHHSDISSGPWICYWGQDGQVLELCASGCHSTVIFWVTISDICSHTPLDCIWTGVLLCILIAIRSIWTASFEEVLPWIWENCFSITGYETCVCCCGTEIKTAFPLAETRILSTSEEGEPSTVGTHEHFGYHFLTVKVFCIRNMFLQATSLTNIITERFHNVFTEQVCLKCLK